MRWNASSPVFQQGKHYAALFTQFQMRKIQFKKNDLKFVMFLPGKFIEGNNAIPVFIFCFKYFLHETRMLVANFFCYKSAVISQFVNLSVEVFANLWNKNIKVIHCQFF